MNKFEYPNVLRNRSLPPHVLIFEEARKLGNTVEIRIADISGSSPEVAIVFLREYFEVLLDGQGGFSIRRK